MWQLTSKPCTSNNTVFTLHELPMLFFFLSIEYQSYFSSFQWLQALYNFQWYTMPSALNSTKPRFLQVFWEKKPSSLGSFGFPFIRNLCRSTKKPVQYSKHIPSLLFCLGVNYCSCFSFFPCSFHFSKGEKFLEAGNIRAWFIPNLVTNSAVNFLWSDKPPVTVILISVTCLVLCFFVNFLCLICLLCLQKM